MIEIRSLHKEFKGKKVLRGVDLDIHKGEALAIIGRSGCGKSVLLKHIVGLLAPDEGYVKVEGKLVGDLSRKELYEIRRKFGFLFQGAALFDSMSVEENIALPIMENNFNLSVAELEKQIAEKLELVGLPGIQKLKPAELSGGMRKRVGLARALITNPDYILYDEPTTGLDPIMSDSIDDLIRELNSRLKVTTIMVTHDMYSVKTVASRIAMVHEGQIYFNGTPDEIINSKDEVINNFVRRTGF
ncbi:MAG: ABC transporter ATP-binding protein [Ignavibacteriales bacterium]|nr:ABC transporter ATP-binding protein [Ignavibacteriales bacterium]MCF8307345.1 ABC transporter ATP-binding protein [Ignavibacteriales bacterium]MCF8316496.1 ABC transporter ATP-binding protein [Ignavibacteriales bacterium]MCF8437419.1 ABC transporter ATP-binding protein [Ignavibacteriales bacterium]